MQLLDVVPPTGTPSYPAVSLLLSIEGAPLSHVRLRLRHLAAEAVRRLTGELDAPAVAVIDDRLGAAVDSVELVDGQQGVAVYVGEQTSVVPLSVRVRDRVVVDDTFATRDLVRALQRSARYRVAMLGPKRTRLYDGTGFRLTEVDNIGLSVAGGAGRASAARGRVSRDSRTGGEGAGIDEFIRSLDSFLDAHLRPDPLPLVLVGTEPRLRAVAARSRHRAHIVGTVRGAHDFPDRRALGALVWPTIDQLLGRQTAEAIGELERAGGSRRFASGVSEVWTLANHGRGDLLLVEESFEYPARVDPGTGEAVAATDRDAAGVVDDLVDEIVEIVIAKGGRCLMVPDGRLAGHDRIAMKLRY